MCRGIVVVVYKHGPAFQGKVFSRIRNVVGEDKESRVIQSSFN